MATGTFASTIDTIDVEGVSLAFKRYKAEAPSKQPLVMIHGASGNLHDLDLALMPDAGIDRDVLIFDRPGLGRSDRPKGGA